ncbi:MAG: GNAT family N-acetyltransferase [Caulobacterales bacterium]
MSAPPKTVLVADAAEAERIRQAVRRADIAGLGPGRVIAAPAHAETLATLLADPAVSGPVYDLPRPLTVERIGRWIEASEAERQAGEGLLTLTLDEAGRAASYLKFTVWPDRSSAEVGGAVRADRQNSGRSAAGAGQLFNWIFETLGVRLMGLTADVNNIRSIRMIDATGFTRMGERDCIRADGSTRRSVYWEMSRDAWRRNRAARTGQT